MDLDLDHPAEEDTMTIDDDHSHSPRQDQDGDALMDTETDGLAEEVYIAEDDELEVEYEHDGDDMDAEDTPPVKEHLVSPFGAVGELSGEVNPFMQNDRPSFHIPHDNPPIQAQAGPSSGVESTVTQPEGEQTPSSHQVLIEQTAGQDQDQEGQGEEEDYEYDEDHDQDGDYGEEEGDGQPAEGDGGEYDEHVHEPDEEEIGDHIEEPGETGAGHLKGGQEKHTPVAEETFTGPEHEAEEEQAHQAGKHEEARNRAGGPSETLPDIAKDPQASSEVDSTATLAPIHPPSPSGNPSSVESSQSTLENEQEFTLEIDEVDDMEDYPTEVHSMPAIILHLPNLGARSLFLPLPDGSKLPVWLQGRLEQLGESSLTDVWGAIKEEMAKEKLTQSGEMIITEKQMELQMGEDDLNLQSVTLLEFAQVHYGCGLPSPIQLYITFEPHRFVTRFNAIQQEVQAQLNEGENADVVDVEEHEDEAEESKVDTDGKDNGEDSHDDERREDYLREKRARGGNAEHGSTRPRPAPVESEHPNADWAHARPIAPIHINGTTLYTPRTSQEPEESASVAGSETKDATTPTTERGPDFVTVPPPPGRQDLQEIAERRDEISEGGKERYTDDKDTIDSTDTNMTEEYFERRVDMKLPGDEDGITVPADEIELLHKGDKYPNTPIDSTDVTIEPTEPLATPLDSVASAVPEETSGERLVTYDGLTTLEETSGDTEYSKDGDGLDDEAIDVSADASDPMQLVAQQAEEAQILADESAAISGEIADTVSDALVDEGYSDPDVDAKVKLAEQIVAEKEDALAQAHDEAVQADLDAASVQSDNIDAIADQAVADSLIESPAISPAATLGDEEVVSLPLADSIDETPISATSQPSLETTNDSSVSLIDEDGDLIPEEDLNSVQKRRRDILQEYADETGQPLEDVTDSELSSKKLRFEW